MFALHTTPTSKATMVSPLRGSAAWIRQRGKKVTPTGLLIGLVTCSVTILSSGPAVAHPPPPGVFGCAHTHGLAGNCILNAPGGACVRPNGQPGICKNLGRGAFFCACVDDNGSGSLIAGLSMMEEVVTVVLDSKKAKRTVGQDALCAQNNALATHFMVSHDAIRSLDPSDRQVYAPEFLRQVDFVAMNLKKFASALRSCDIDIPTDTVADTLQQTKLNISSSAASFLGLEESNLGDWPDFVGATCSATVAGCNISSFAVTTVNTSTNEVTIGSFGTNGTVVFAPTGNNSGEVGASDLEIMDQPGYACELIPMSNGSRTIMGGCTDSAGSCTHQFECF